MYDDLPMFMRHLQRRSCAAQNIISAVNEVNVRLNMQPYIFFSPLFFDLNQRNQASKCVNILICYPKPREEIIT